MIEYFYIVYTYTLPIINFILSMYVIYLLFVRKYDFDHIHKNFDASIIRNEELSNTKIKQHFENMEIQTKNMLENFVEDAENSLTKIIDRLEELENNQQKFKENEEKLARNQESIIDEQKIIFSELQEFNKKTNEVIRKKDEIIKRKHNQIEKLKLKLLENENKE